MKKLLLILLIIILVLFAGLALFIATFDLNRYKNEIERQIENRTGYPAQIGSLAFSAKHGLSLEAGNFKLSPKPGSPPNSFLFQVKHFFLKLELEPLFRREIHVSECVFESPSLELSSAFLAEVSQQNSVTAPSAVLEKASPSGIASRGEFRISKIQIMNGSLRYEDAQSAKPVTLNIQNINLALTNVSFITPLQFEGSADAVLGVSRHISTHGTFSYPDQSLAFDLIMDHAIKADGTVAQLFRLPVYQMRITVNDLDLESFYETEQKQKEYFSGRLSAGVELSASGRRADDILDSVSAKGEIRIKSGALKNRNLIRENLEKITQIPGMNLIFESDLGTQFDPLMKGRDTTFDMLETSFRMAGRRIMIDSVRLIHSHYVVTVSGIYLVRGPLQLKASLDLGMQISAALVHKVKELKYLADQRGHMIIPFAVEGELPGAQVRPNVGNLVGQAVENIAPQLIDKALTSLLKPKKNHANETNAEAQTTS